jgi:hypothetical protein
MLGAKFLPLVEVFTNSGITASEIPREVFEIGFVIDSGRWERGAKIKQITSTNARDSGLKEGDELRGFSFKYGNTQEQASFTVQRGGETLSVKYFPKKTVKILQIDENAKIPK